MSLIRNENARFAPLIVNYNTGLQRVEVSMENANNV